MPTDPGAKKRNLLHLLLAILIGGLFFLPQPVRVASLHSVRDYSPFSARSSSPTTLDETFLYGPEVNYTYRHHWPADDTDAFEHRNQPVPYSLLPTEVEAVLAHLFRSVIGAQILCYFLFPAITAWLLMDVFQDLEASLPLAALLTLFTLVASFSLRTLEIGTSNLLRHGLHSAFIETLQASRNPNPNMTFPLFLGALFAQIRALLRRSIYYAVFAGILGGLLFYSYIYYAIAWAIAVTLLVLIAALHNRTCLRTSLAALLSTVFTGVPFLFWVRASKRAGGYLYRTDRLGAIHTHIPAAHDIKLGTAFVICLLSLWAGWRYFVARREEPSPSPFPSATAVVFGCAAAGGILGMNMEILTGTDVQFNHHFPHMVIQPALILLLLTVLLSATCQLRQKRSTRWASILFVAFFLVCALTQVEAAINSAPLHREVPSEQALFHWLNQNTHPGDVVATDSIELALYMPLYSQDYTLMVNGSRTSASDSEILDRFLLAEALTGVSTESVAEKLGRGIGTNLPNHAPWTSYPAFFFEHSPDLASSRALTPQVLNESVANYRSLDVAEQLKRFRVDYLYALNGQQPAKVAGITWQKVLVTSDGVLYRLNRTGL